MSVFKFKKFEVENSASALKVGTDAVLLGAVVSLEWVIGGKSSDGAEKTEGVCAKGSPATPVVPLRILDVGTGTGVIALMMAQRLAETEEQFHIDAIDIDGPSAEEAKLNFAGSPWAAHLAAWHCALAQWGGGAYDLIISNPPYFENSLRNPDARESTARHADTLSYRDLCAYAVAGRGTDSGGQTAARLQLAPSDLLHGGLSPDGRLAMILPAEQETDLRRTAASFGLYPARIVRVRTTDRKAPKRTVVELARGRGPTREEQLTIREDGDFTPEYRSYVHPFLLYL